MITRRLDDFSQIETLYDTCLKKDFPPDELRPLDSLRRSWEENTYDCYGLFDGDMTVGCAFFVRKGKDSLFDYLAIAPERRGEGLGSVFLRQLSECLREAECIVVEVEDPDAAENEESRRQRERRLRFYLRNGYRETELTSVVFGVRYRILEAPTGAEHTAEKLRSVYTGLYRSILPERFFRTQFRVS